MILSKFTDFLNEYIGFAILVLFAIILVIYFIVSFLIQKYKPLDEPQSEEEIQKEYMESVTVTEEYKPIPKRKKKVEDSEPKDE
jgi:Na+-transporting methylmalonyl-CoA/oxaloacetate decarboxylase gamma subunit